jgi:ferrochelatase
VADHLRDLSVAGVERVVVSPIGFISDHMEVVYDLDVEAKDVADRLGLQLIRVATVGADPAFVTMIRRLVEERLDPSQPRLALGDDGPWPDRCPLDHCAPPAVRSAG